MPGDILLVLSDREFVSFAARFRLDDKGKVRVDICRHRLSPLSLPNVARKVIAHELGHAISLGYNDDRTTLLYRRPAACRPDAFQSSAARSFPLTEHEKAPLRNLYPSTWKPSP